MYGNSNTCSEQNTNFWGNTIDLEYSIINGRMV